MAQDESECGQKSSETFTAALSDDVPSFAIRRARAMFAQRTDERTGAEGGEGGY